MTSDDVNCPENLKASQMVGSHALYWGAGEGRLIIGDRKIAMICKSTPLKYTKYVLSVGYREGVNLKHVTWFPGNHNPLDIPYIMYCVRSIFDDSLQRHTYPFDDPEGTSSSPVLDTLRRILS